MANIKSAKKRDKQSKVRRQRNLARRTAIKTILKKTQTSIEKGDDKVQTEALLKEAAAKLSRAKSKGVIHKNTASRKLSRLAKQASQSTRT